MANPRKFSEKIALHNQKQAEETAAFEKIMREVSDATAKVSPTATLAPGLGSFRGGSLPNVSEPKRKQPPTQNANEAFETKPDDPALVQFGLNTVQQQQQQQQQQLPQQHMTDSNLKTNDNQTNSMYRESRGRSVGVGPMRRPADRKIDTSPYSSGNVAYLSPPSDSSWRRTSSDSAIHQSLQQNQDHHYHGGHSPFNVHHSPTAQRRITNVSSNIDIKTYSNEHGNQHVSGANDGRPRSSCGLSRLPGINIYPSSHDNTIQIPIGNNTGSLPDLTSVHFPSPLHNPIDQEQDHSSSPYSSSPITASPTTLSPTSIPARHPSARFQYSPAHSPGDSSTFSPTHSQHGTSQGLPLENAYQPSQGGQQQQTQQPQQQQQSQHQQPQHQSYGNISNQQINYQNNQHSPPNNVLHGSHGNLTNLANIPQSNLSGYRSPKRRPSPGPSPGVGCGTQPTGSESNTSAPCSPASQSLGNNGQYEQFQSTEYYLNPSIQQHFEQFSLVDSTVPEYIAQSPNAQNYSQYDDGSFSNLNNSTNMDASLQQQQHHQQQNQQQQQQQHQQQQSPSTQNQKMPNSNMVNSMNTNNQQQHQQQQHLQSTQQSLNSSQHIPQHQQQQQMSNNSQTPNTPTSIPEIIFTDFSSAATELSKDLFGDPLRPIDLELGTMDFAGYQMLTDPNATMIADPTIEDSFRRDLN